MAFSLDTRIPLSSEPPRFNDPFAMLGQIRAQQQDAQIRQQQIASQQALEEERRQRVADAQKQAQELDVYKGIIGNPDLTPDTFLEEVRTKAPGQYDATVKRLQEHDRNALEMKKLRMDLQTQSQAWIGGMLDDVVASNYDPRIAELTLKKIEAEEPDFKPQADQIREELLKGGSTALKTAVDRFRPKPKQEGFTLSEGQTRFGPDGQPIANVPKPAPESKAGTLEDYIETVAKARGKTTAQLSPLDKKNAKAEWEAAGRAPTNDNEPLQIIMGPDGKPVYVPRSQAVGKQPATGSLKPASGVEKKALGFFNRAEQADKDLEALEPTIQSKGLAGQTYMNWAPNFAQTQEGQSYQAAQRAFTEARLRKDSGAAIPDTEFENDRKTYFAQPGDSKATLEQKRRSRAALLASLAFESGQALGEYVGDANEAKSVIEGYKARAAKGGPAAAAGGKVTVTDPNGTKHDFASQAEADAFKKLAGIP